MNLHAHIHYQAGYEPNNWHYTVDYVTEGNPKGDFSINSLDYGNVESFERALECVKWVFENAESLDEGRWAALVEDGKVLTT